MRKDITSKDDLVAYFQEGCKMPNQLKIGVEHEKFIFKKKLVRELIFKRSRKFLTFCQNLDGNL